MKQNITKGTVARTAALAFALVNQILTVSGKNPLPFTENEVSQAVSMALTIAASVAAWWKNNSFTQAAISADEILKQLRQ